MPVGSLPLPHWLPDLVWRFAANWPTRWARNWSFRVARPDRTVWTTTDRGSRRHAMTNMNEPQDPRQPGTADSPGDIPAGRPPALSRLEALLGEWEMEVSFIAGYFGPGSPPVAGRGGRTTFEWLDGE